MSLKNILYNDPDFDINSSLLWINSSVKADNISNQLWQYIYYEYRDYIALYRTYEVEEKKFEWKKIFYAIIMTMQKTHKKYLKLLDLDNSNDDYFGKNISKVVNNANIYNKYPKDDDKISGEKKNVFEENLNIKNSLAFSRQQFYNLYNDSFLAWVNEFGSLFLRYDSTEAN